MSDISKFTEELTNPARFEELMEKNPGVDGAQMREAQELLAELRRGGVAAPSYGLVSPYERRAFQKSD